MKILDINTVVDFNRVRLLPADDVSIKSRQEISTDISLNGIDFSVPFLVPPMRSLYSSDVARKVADFGTVMVVPRTATGQDWVTDPLIVNSSIDNALHIAEMLVERFPQSKKVLSIEVANGHMTKLREKVAEVRRLFPDLVIWAGTVITRDGVDRLGDSGANAILIGIGVGSACITTNKTGVGLPAFATVVECAYGNYPVILTGGLREHGDVAKALVAGASAVYCGSLLRGAKDLHDPHSYIGEASEKAKAQDGKKNHIEGIELRQKPRHQTVVEILQEMQDDLKSSMSYCNARNIFEFRNNANLIVLP